MQSGREISKYAVIAVACVVCVLALDAVRVFAENGRNFAGFYKILQVTEQRDTVEVRLSLHVFNYSGGDVKDARISLESFLPHPPGDDPRDPQAAWEKEQEQPTFQGVALRVNEHKRVPPLEGTFTVPTREYGEWLKGAKPGFVIDFHDASGKPQRQAIELTRLP